MGSRLAFCQLVCSELIFIGQKARRDPIISHYFRPHYFLQQPTNNGGYFIKVSLSNTIWRRIKIQGTESVDTLAVAILNAFNFDDEHLYEFRYTDNFGITQVIADPRCEEPLNACEINIGDIDILPGDLIEFLYDFGDNWKFKVQIEKIDPELKIKKPTIIEREGKAPRQYSYY